MVDEIWMSTHVDLLMSITHVDRRSVDYPVDESIQSIYVDHVDLLSTH